MKIISTILACFLMLNGSPKDVSLEQLDNAIHLVGNTVLSVLNNGFPESATIEKFENALQFIEDAVLSVLDDDSPKDAAIEQLDKVIQLVGDTILTGNPVGKLDYGIDHYTGTYVAEYEGFSNTEFLFGGIGVVRKEGDSLSVNCVLRVVDGTAKVFCKSGGDDEIILIEEDGIYSGTVTISKGSNYIGIECDNFTGSIDLNIE